MFGSKNLNNYAHLRNRQTKRDTEYFNKEGNTPVALSSNHCFDFCQHRLVVRVPLLNFIGVKSHSRPYFCVWVILLDIIFFDIRPHAEYFSSMFLFIADWYSILQLF